MIGPIVLAATVAFTDVDDARACMPLANGGVAVATGGGLVLSDKDGKTHKTLTALDGLPETRVHAVVESSDGVWVGTEGGAALVADGKVVRTVLSAPVNAVHVSPNGSIWLGTRGQGVYRLSAKDAAPQLVPTAAKGTHVAAIAEKDGSVFVAYADGPLAKLESGTLKPVAGSPTHGESLVAAEGALVLGDLEGLYRVDDKGFTSIGSVDARGLAANGSTIVVATYGTGVMSGTTRGVLRVDTSVAARNARGVGVRGNRRCVATTTGVFVDEGAGSFQKLALGASLPSNDITAIAANGSRVAVGTFDAGAAIVENGNVTRVKGIERTETVNGLAWQGDKLWLATVHGLYRVGPDGGVRRFTSQDGLPSTFSRSIAVVSNDKILVGTESGPAFVEGERITPLVDTKKGSGPSSIASPMHATWAVAARSDGMLFIGTAAGLYYGKDGRFERASLASGAIEDDWVTALALDGAKDVYVGTYSKGVTHLRFDGAAVKATHLGGGYVNSDGLVVDGGKLYAATMENLLVRTKDDDTSGWTSKKGSAPGRDVTGIRLASSSIWIGSRRGISVISP